MASVLSMWQQLALSIPMRAKPDADADPDAGAHPGLSIVLPLTQLRFVETR